MFTAYIGIGIGIGAVSVIVPVATSGLCYYMYVRKKRHTAKKGLTTTANPAYGANVEFEADPNTKSF